MEISRNSRSIFLVVSLLLALVSLVFVWVFRSEVSAEKQLLHQPNAHFIEEVKRWATITPNPNHTYSYAPFEKGVIQHLDRNYTYDVIPAEMNGGILFQGIHRPPTGTSLTITLSEPVTVYFFFHDIFDGGYTEIFKNLPLWRRTSLRPQYDIANGEHGLSMITYVAVLPEGTYSIPPTTEDKACFSLVLQRMP